MPRWAIGDLQGCHDEFLELLKKIGFRADRDRLWLTGDLVNRGPKSLDSLRRVRAMGDNLATVLGNHDLHLLAAGFGGKSRKGDTLAEILDAPDRDALLGWLLERPLAHRDDGRDELLVHAGLVPQWTADDALELARAVGKALRKDPEGFFATMYGDKPDTWDPELTGEARRRFVVNVLTRLRFCTADGRIDLKAKGAPDSAQGPLKPWFAHPRRRHAGTRIVFGHWSTLGLHRGDGVLGLDTGCVWGGALTAVNLDDDDAPPVSLPCRAWQEPGD